MNIYIASKSSRPECALNDGNVIEVCWGGPNPQGDAEQYAKDWTKATEDNTYVYAATLAVLRGFKVHKEVTSFVPAR